MTAIALDDEPLALTLVATFARQIPELELLATFTNAEAAGEYLKNNTVDLLLTDINMPDISGLNFVRELQDERPMIIFITAYKEHAHEGFDLDVIDYLVKPISPERFARAIRKATDRMGVKNIPQEEPDEDFDHFFVFSEYQQVKVYVPHILYIEGMGDYVKIHLESQPRPLLTLERMKNLEEKLKKKNFRRIHRSYLINFSKVEAMQKSQVKIQGKWLPVGEKYLKSTQ